MRGFRNYFSKSAVCFTVDCISSNGTSLVKYEEQNKNQNKGFDENVPPRILLKVQTVRLAILRNH